MFEESTLWENDEFASVLLVARREYVVENPQWCKDGYGAMMNPVSLVKYLNCKAGAAGVGISDHIEDRIVGIKSRVH